MSDAMVTGRMNAAKKQAGNRILAELGSTASQAINQLYDYVIAEHALPFGQTTKEPLTSERIDQARTFVSSLPQKNAFSSLSDEDIKKRRMLDRFGVSR